jgi:glycine hydroxymethyltransferase
MDESDLDQVADIICGVLTAAEPTTTAAGALSKAKFTLDDNVRETTRARSAELLAANPLYPEVGML